MALFSSDDPLLEPGQVAHLLGVTQKTLQDWRTKGRGPAYVKLGTRGVVRYHIADVSEWLATHRHEPQAARGRRQG